MDAFSTLARAAHAVVLAAWTGAFALVLRLPGAVERVEPSRHHAGAVVLAVLADLERWCLWGLPILLVTLWVGWPASNRARRRRGRTSVVILLGLLTLASRYVVRPQFEAIRDGLGRPVEGLPGSDPALAAYAGWEWTLFGLVALQALVAVVLLVWAVARSRPQSSFGIQL